VDWLARALPTEGEKAGETRAGDLVRDDAVTCGLEDRIGEVRPRVEASPYGFGFVVSANGVLLGRLRKKALDGDPETTAEQAMEPGPSTLRPSASLDTVYERMEQRDLQTAVITTPAGELLGVVLRRDVRESRG
jgi:CBS domain-containing protein